MPFGEGVSRIEPRRLERFRVLHTNVAVHRFLSVRFLSCMYVHVDYGGHYHQLEVGAAGASAWHTEPETIMNGGECCQQIRREG